MLKLIDIRKTYKVGDFEQHALDGISVSFRKSEFVAIVGPSGSGKTTTLNIIGGLDRYDSGDIIINGKSTKDFKDSEWDSYRNGSIGFVFQNYNLISHITVLDNVEMGMTLSGLPAKTRRKRAAEVLERVGLKDHMLKRPNQLSGGQMQRVAIARALANDPDIIMADEPTGALDSVTSIQIMELIREIAKDKLVILVTHNIEIANRYANRIIHMSDGKIVDDSNPYEPRSTERDNFSLKKTAMSFRQALNLSFNNLKTKLGRALITAFAGSIGIIGVGLVLSLSNGLNKEIADLETGTLSDFPLSISPTAYIMRTGQQMMGNFTEDPEGQFPTESLLYAVDQQANTIFHKNVINQDYLDFLDGLDPALYNEISYGRSVAMNLFTTSESDDSVMVVDTGDIDWGEIPGNAIFVENNYDILAGSFPIAPTELLLVVDTYNNIDLRLLTAIGYDGDIETLGFDDIIGKEFRIVFNDDYYTYSDLTTLYYPSLDYEALYDDPDTLTLSIVGIARATEDAASTVLGEGILYQKELTDIVLAGASGSAIALAQADRMTNVMTGVALTEQTKSAMLKYLGADTIPVSIRIFPVDFDAKNAVKEFLSTYNDDKAEVDQVIYTDLAETITDTVGTFVDTITYVLVAFSAISLVVSSIMIGIITYVSVLERTKEIGILRALGARKKDISRVFNAETFLIGLTAGLMGTIITWVLTFPINAILGNLLEEMSSIANFSITAIVSLIAISIILTLFSGLVPSRIAARKDPVEALRTE
ncbi:MAG: sulfate ABC transporter ATP-binding protein [Tenericutes bacterium GWF2_57_13]|nr:MAG: sulfate ABC transporter ATP-binding protein [Tenericutes bacterium GWF2_57_13]